MATRPLPNLDRDYRIFLWFMTLIIGAMYVWLLATTPSLRQPLLLLVFTVLLIIHVALHWLTDKVYNRPRLLLGYILLQGALAFVIVLLSNNIGMVFALFLALIGECIGMLGFSRGGLLGCAYFLVLSLVSFLYFTTPSGFVWWLLGTVPTVLFVGVYITLYNRQIQANERSRELLAELETANQRLSEYAAQVEDLTIASERQRMARELHDTLSQGLAGLILQLEAADAHLAHERPEKARQIVQQTMEQARVTLGEARRAIDDLRRGAAPTLEESIRQEVARCTAAGLPCTLEMELPGELPSAQSDAIARIVPEALTNILMHAHASRAWVNLRGGESGVSLEIGDDGVGFDPAATPPGHYGLIGMRERARLAGGEMEIESQPGAGMRLVVRFSAEKGQA